MATDLSEKKKWLKEFYARHGNYVTHNQNDPAEKFAC